MFFRKLEKGSFSLIEKFINEIDHEFVPLLSNKVDICKWATKLDIFAINFVSLNQYNNIEALLSFYINETSYITFFSISKEHRGKGLGSKLLDTCIDECKKKQSHSIRVETWLSNKKALKLYLSRGFKQIETRNDRPGDSTIALEKKL